MNLQKEIKALENKYTKEVERIALREFDKTIKPWLIKNHYRFSSGMGTWAIYFGDFYISRDDLPKYITNILECEVMNNWELGEFLRDFPANT